MPHTISHHIKLPLLAGACALAISFTPAFAAGGGGGHVGGMGAMTTSPSVARPMVAPPDQKTGPSAVDTSPHAPFHKLNNPPQPQPGSPGVSSHAPLMGTGPLPAPTGTRLPPDREPSAPRLDPPPG